MGASPSAGRLLILPPRANAAAVFRLEHGRERSRPEVLSPVLAFPAEGRVGSLLARGPAPALCVLPPRRCLGPAGSAAAACLVTAPVFVKPFEKTERRGAELCCGLCLQTSFPVKPRSRCVADGAGEAPALGS